MSGPRRVIKKKPKIKTSDKFTEQNLKYIETKAYINRDLRPRRQRI